MMTWIQHALFWLLLTHIPPVSGYPVLNKTENTRDCLDCFKNTSDVDILSPFEQTANTSDSCETTSVSRTTNYDGPTSTSDNNDRLQEEKRVQDMILFICNGVYLPCVIFVCVVGNCLTVTVLYRGALNSSMTTFFMGLAIADMLSEITSSPYVLLAYPNIADMPTVRTFYAFWRSYGFALVLMSVASSTWVTVCLAIERLILVCFPIKAKGICTAKRARTAVLSIYAAFVLLFSVEFWVYEPVVHTERQTNETFYQARLSKLGRTPQMINFLFWGRFLVLVAVPFSLLAVANCCIIYNLRSARRFQKDMQRETGLSVTPKVNTRDLQITRLLICIVLCFLLCHTCSAVAAITVAVVGDEGLEDNRFVAFVRISNQLGNSNHALNFVIHATSSTAIGRALRKLICPCRGQHSPRPA